jgi:hypothetical protein
MKEYPVLTRRHFQTQAYHQQDNIKQEVLYTNAEDMHRTNVYSNAGLYMANNLQDSSNVGMYRGNNLQDSSNAGTNTASYLQDSSNAVMLHASDIQESPTQCRRQELLKSVTALPQCSEDSNKVAHDINQNSQQWLNMPKMYGPYTELECGSSAPPPLEKRDSTESGYETKRSSSESSHGVAES